MRLMSALAIALSLLLGQAPAVPPPGSKAPLYTYEVVHTYPHDRDAYTQGLEYVGGILYESTGLNGRSSIRKVKLETGEVTQRREISNQYFGEGITLWKGDLVELTWVSETGFVYDSQTFEPKKTFTYMGEGWGLTHDSSGIVMSDGTAALRFLDPVTLAERKRVKVTDGGSEVRLLNELEFVKGEILANVYTTDFIARIAPATGKVVGWIDMRGLLTPRERATTDVLNGIAYDAEHDRLFVTGKLWPKLFEIKLVPRK
jgi:glutaminyl-peptide cyclotransferase